MLSKSSNNFIKFLLIPLALCAMMASVSCERDNSKEEFYQQALLNLMSCKGGSMDFTIGSTGKSWKCCIVTYADSHYIVVGSSGSELIKLHVGDGATGNHSGTTISGNNYIQYTNGSKNYLGVNTSPYNDGDSTINITNNPTTITGTFSGQVCDDTATCLTISVSGVFSALK